jgi:hypothetical protein
MTSNEQNQKSQHRPKAPRVAVQVTREIIDSAEQRDSSHCMIAEAVKAAVPGAAKVSVDLQTIRFTDPQRRLRYVYLTPRQAQLALVAFDQGLHTDPFSMTLRGAQVLKVGDPKAPRPEGKTPPMPEGKRVELVQRQNDHPGVPEVVGGYAPPVAALSNTRYGGKRRAFGLRGLHL